MNEKQYVNAIVRKIKCSTAKRKDIKKQLLGEVCERENRGESMAGIVEQMGSPKEIAEGFNETISDAEKKKYSRNKRCKILCAVVLFIALAVFAISRGIPRQKDIEKSTFFDTEEVEASMKEIVSLLDAGDYEELRQKAIPEMQQVLTEETMEKVKEELAEDWGERLQFGKAYTTELVQGNLHYAVGEITVVYENVSATYRITFDSDMLLAGLYIR